MADVVSGVPPTSESPAADSPSPKRRSPRRKRRKVSRPRSPRPNPLQLQPVEVASPGSVEPSTTSSEPDRFEEAASRIEGELGGGDSAGAPIDVPGEVLPNFDNWAAFVVPKTFDLLAIILGKHWPLKEEERVVLVPAAAASLAEVWPHLPQWLKDLFESTNFPKTIELAIVLGLTVWPRVEVTKELWKKAKQQSTGQAPGSVTTA